MQVDKKKSEKHTKSFQGPGPTRLPMSASCRSLKEMMVLVSYLELCFSVGYYKCTYSRAPAGHSDYSGHRGLAICSDACCSGLLRERRHGFLEWVSTLRFRLCALSRKDGYRRAA